MSKETLKPCPFCGRAPKWVEIADARSAEMVGPWRKLTCSSGWNDETCRVSPFLQYHTDKWAQGKGTSRVNRDAEFGRIWNARAEGLAPPAGGVPEEAIALLRWLKDRRGLVDDYRKRIEAVLAKLDGGEPKE